jgi:hypothetical protein
MEFVMQFSEYPIVQHSVVSDKYPPALLRAIHSGDTITDNISKYLNIDVNFFFYITVGKTDSYPLKTIRQNKRRATESVLYEVPLEVFADEILEHPDKNTGGLYLKMSNF